jgi:hypothetical protein
VFSDQGKTTIFQQTTVADINHSDLILFDYTSLLSWNQPIAQVRMAHAATAINAYSSL